MPDNTLAVVFVSYLKVPVERLMDHFRWNEDVYASFGDRLRVYVVSDVDHELPSDATCVVFPLDRLPMIQCRRRFSLTQTKNAGIQRAIADGCDVIVATDVDIVLPRPLVARMFNVTEQQAVIPVYLMAEDFVTRYKGHLDHGCTGTVAMTAANWKRIPYDEECVEYGGDDGILLRDIERAGLGIQRDKIVSHIAHVPGDGERTPGRGADTCWGREDGFNRDNFRKNRRLHRARGRR